MSLNLNNRHFRKLFNIFDKDLSLLKKPKILEFGVSDQAMSTSYFLEYCEKNDGSLLSVDIKDYSHKFKSRRWKFIQSRDDDFTYLDKVINDQVSVIYLDTIHKADHIEKIFFHYYPMLIKDGFFLIDDISWLPYIENAEKNHFYIERNNQESFEKILEIYQSNKENFDLEFSFIGTGVAKIKKINNSPLNKVQRINLRKYNLHNFLRKVYKLFIK